MKPLQLVIIDDEEAHFQLMKRAINKEFPLASVYYFEEAAACLERLDEITADVIITDYLMPGMNGIEFIEALSRENKDIPVIMITGQGNESIAVRAMKLGAWDYLVKSSDFFTLLPSVIEKVVRERKLKESLQRSEQRFKEIFAESPIGIALHDRNGLLVESNQSALDIFGVSDVAHMKGFKLFDDPNVPPEAKAKLLKGETVRYEVPFDFEEVKKLRLYETTKSGTVYLDVVITPMGHGTDHRVVGYLVQIQDTTERKRAQESQRESEARLRAIFEAAENVSLIMTNLAGTDSRILEFNRGAERIFGYNREEVIGKPVAMLHLPEDVVRFPEVIEAMRQRRAGFSGESTLVRKSGERFPAIFTTYPIFDAEGNMTATLGVSFDITKRKQAEEHIRSLTQQLMKAQENERQRLSHKLHDLVGQDLSALKIGLDTLFDDHHEAPPGTRQRVAELSKMVQGTIMAVRDLAYGLRPTSLDQLGLAKTVLRYCEEFSANTGVKVDFFAAGIDDLKLDSDTEITLYRLIQEGLNNVKKHADATDAAIRLVASFPNIILRIEDNGKGFDVQNRLVSALNEKHMGFRSMEERVALLGGKMSIESRAMQGTKILIEIPIKRKK